MNKILVALDHSEVSSLVLQTAVDLAKAQNAELILLRAYSMPVDVPMDIYYRPKDDIAEVLRRESEKEIHEQSQKIPSEIKKRVLVEMGVPWHVICDVAKREDASLILMGAHGYRFYERMLGTTAGRVITHADRSVYVVRPKASSKK